MRIAIKSAQWRMRRIMLQQFTVEAAMIKKVPAGAYRADYKAFFDQYDGPIEIEFRDPIIDTELPLAIATNSDGSAGH
jgi:hypothetical protein